MAQGEGFKHITVTAPAEEDEVVFAGVPTGAQPAPPARAPQPAQPAPSARAPQPAQPAARRDPTLADLEGAPMPLVQKVVIIAALICIIGAVIYYFAFMG